MLSNIYGFCLPYHLNIYFFPIWTQNLKKLGYAITTSVWNALERGNKTRKSVLYCFAKGYETRTVFPCNILNFLLFPSHDPNEIGVMGYFDLHKKELLILVVVKSFLTFTVSIENRESILKIYVLSMPICLFWFIFYWSTYLQPLPKS